MKRGITLALLAALALATSVLSPGAIAQQEIDPADFSSEITNPYLPLSLIGPKLFIGEETDDEGETVETRLESKLLPNTTVVDGVTVAILEERAYEDGELIEVALTTLPRTRTATSTTSVNTSTTTSTAFWTTTTASGSPVKATTSRDSSCPRRRRQV